MIHPHPLKLSLYLSLLVFVAAGSAAAGAPDAEWRYHAHDPGGARYSPLDQITSSNVVQLERAWTYRTGDIAEGAAHYAQCTPLVADNVLYLITPFSRLIALDATTGEERWRFSPDPPLDLRETGGGGLASRGVAYSDHGGKRRIFLPVRDGRIYAIDVDTHLADPDFGNAGHIDLRAGLRDGGGFLFLSSPPTIYRNVLIQPYGINDTSADLLEYVPLRAYDTDTGALLWTFDTVPQPGQYGHDTWAGDSWQGRAGCNPWAPISVDPERGIFYVPVGAPNSDKFGGDRPGDNLYGNAIVALDAMTGSRIWHHQTVRHDLWDYDLAALPILFDWREGGAGVPAVAVLGKTGFVYLFNRVTGAPLFPIEDRPVPGSDFPGERPALTQPVPSRPPAFSRQHYTPADISNLDAATHAEVREVYAGLRNEGLFTPPSGRGTIVLPGQHGGANWSGAAVSPEGMLYVAATELPYISSIRASDGPYGATPSARAWLDANGYPAISPPWGTLTKIDLNKGELVWQEPLGVFPELIARGIPPTGTPNFGGATVTAGGLVLAAATMDARLRAFEASSGRVIWETQLEAAAYNAPVTYLDQQGRQVIVVFAGGGGKYKTPPGDYVMAYRLP